MCLMKNKSVVLLFFTVFCCFFRDSIGKTNKKVSCKVVPLKADVIFSGTVLEIIKRQNLAINFAKRRRRRRRKNGKGKVNAK